MRPESEQAAEVVRARIGDAPVDVGLILGSGLSTFADHLVSPIVIPYSALPGFNVSRLAPETDLIVGTLGTARVVVMRGRVGYHESGNIAGMRVPLETFKLLGASAIVLTTAAGSVRPEIRPGTLVAIRDHINLTGLNPLIGDQVDAYSVDMTGAYDAVLRERFAMAAGETGRKISEGVLMWFPGPSYETPAEIVAARALGADLVGMTTVPDVVIARNLGLRVLALAMVTNLAAGLSGETLGREQTMRVAAASIVPLTRVLLKFFEIWVLDGRKAR